MIGQIGKCIKPLCNHNRLITIVLYNFRTVMELRHYIDAFSTLHTAKVKGHKAPHKAVLLLAIIDLVEEKRILTPRIGLTDELAEKFNELWHRYLALSSIFTPDISKPYFHMQHESFWRLVDKGEVARGMAAEPNPWVVSRKEQKDLPKGSYSIQAMRRTFAYAEIDGMLFQLLQNSDARAVLRVVLINAYLTNQPTKTMPDIGAILAALPLLAFVA